MAYRLKISGLQYESEVEGAQDWTRTVTRDFNDRLFRTRGDYRFTGHDGLFNLLYNHLAVKGVCEPLEARIYFDTGTDWDYEWRGEIKPQDFEFDMVRRNADGQILDASWAARFNNSEDQRVFLQNTNSSGGEVIGSCPNTSVFLFEPSTGVYDVSSTRMYKVYDIFEYLVNYYTDSTVTFDSDYFDTGNGAAYFITTGRELRLSDSSANPEISFSELFDEMNKKLNLWIVISGTPEAPILRVENWDYVFKEQNIVTIRDPEKITIKTDLDQLYSTISVGASSVQEYEQGSDANYPNIALESWTSEQYNCKSTCSFENNDLNLISSWRIDHNSIEKQHGGSEDFDDDIFIIDAEEIGGIFYAKKYKDQVTNASGLDSFYNDSLANDNVLLNWFNGITQEITKQISDDSYVRVGSPIAFAYGSGTSDIFFDDDSTAPNSDIRDLYTTPTEAGGILQPYQSQFNPTVAGWYKYNININVTSKQSGSLFSIVSVYEDDTRLVEIMSYTVQIINTTGWLRGTAFVYIPDGAVAVMRLTKLGGGGFNIGSNSYAIIEAQEFDYEQATDEPLIYIFEIGQHDLPRADFDLIDQNLGFVRIIDTNGEKYFDVYAKEATYNSTTGVLEGEFIGTRPPTELCWILQDGTWDDDCYWLDSKVWID